MNNWLGFQPVQSGSKSRLIPVLLHISVWAGLSVFFWTVANKDAFFSANWLIRMNLSLAVSAVLFYTNSLILIPRFLLQRKRLVYSILAVLLIAFLIGCGFLIEDLFPEPVKARVLAGSDPHRPGRPPVVFFGIFNSLMVLGISTSLTLIKTWYREEQNRLDAERQKLSGELLALRNQVHPHFFFNTLNNIHSLIDIDPERARLAVLELSKLMRYLLYESEGNRVPLEQEVAFLKNYLRLMRLRLTDEFPVTIRIQENVSSGWISPMMFIPVVENVFKYGISYSDPGPVLIELKEEGDRVVLITENQVVQREKEEESREKIGLANLKRRLQLLYPGNHQLSVTEENHRFLVRLSFPVERHG